MTHSDDLYLAVEKPRRKELRTFIHELKKFVGGEHKLHVTETLQQSSDDSLEIRLHPLTNFLVSFLDAEIRIRIEEMCEEYGIPKRNVLHEIVDDTPTMTIKLYTDFVL